MFLFRGIPSRLSIMKILSFVRAILGPLYLWKVSFNACGISDLEAYCRDPVMFPL